jgi:hypothetical protein
MQTQLSKSWRFFMAEASADKDRMLIAPLKLSDLLDKVTHSN